MIKTVGDIEQELGVPVKIVEESGADFVAAVLEQETERTQKRRQMYEQTDSSNCWQT